MARIIILGAGAMGTAFAFPCLDNKHDVTIVGTHLEDEFSYWAQNKRSRKNQIFKVRKIRRCF